VGYARRLLHEDEELLAELRPHPVVLVGPVVLLALALAGAVAIAVRFPSAPVAVAWLLAAMVVLPALWTAVRLLRWRSVRLVVTSSRLVYRRGVVGRDVVQLRFQRVAEVHCHQSLGARMVGTGRLVFEVAGAEAPLVVDDVRGPRRLQRMITAQLDRLDRPLDRGRYPSAGAPRTWTDTPPHGLVAGAGADARTVPRQIVELDELRRRGILSEAEFAAKKAQLLDRL